MRSSRAGGGISGSRVSSSPFSLMVADLTVRSVLRSFLIEMPVCSWRYRLIASAANTMVRWALDGVTLAMEHRPGTEVGLGHSERPLDLPQVVIGGDHRGTGHGVEGDVADVALQAGELPGAVDKLLVDLLGGPDELEEPHVAHRCLARGDLLGTVDHRVD